MHLRGLVAKPEDMVSTMAQTQEFTLLILISLTKANLDSVLEESLLLTCPMIKQLN
jgi:hypothetical protein